jgi:hypothetical protein
MAKEVRLSNGKVWRTRKDATVHFRDMLSRYKDGENIANPSDDSDLRSLLELYDSVLPPGAKTKAGAGIASFSRERNSGDTWSTPGFHVHRVDGSSEDFSFYRAVQSK